MSALNNRRSRMKEIGFGTAFVETDESPSDAYNMGHSASVAVMPALTGQMTPMNYDILA